MEFPTQPPENPNRPFETTVFHTSGSETSRGVFGEPLDEIKEPQAAIVGPNFQELAERLDPKSLATGLRRYDIDNATTLQVFERASIERLQNDFGNMQGLVALRHQGAEPRPSRFTEWKFEHNKLHPWLRKLDSSLEDAYRSTPLEIATNSIRIVYAPELDDNDPMNFKDHLMDEDKKALYGDEVPDFFTRREVSERLRESGVVDTSKKALDARLKAFTTVASTELAMLGFADLDELAALNPEAREKAMEIFSAYRRTVRSGVFADRADMLYKVFHTFGDLAESHPSPQFSRVLSKLGVKAGTPLEKTSETYEKFRTIYDAFGYEIPPETYDDLRDWANGTLRVMAPPQDAAEPVSEQQTLQEEPPRERIEITSEPPAESPEGPAAPGETDQSPTEVHEEQVAAGGIAEAVRQRLRSHEMRQMAEQLLPAAHGGHVNQDVRDRLKEIAKQTAKGEGNAAPDVVWARIEDLLTICEQNNGMLYRSKGLGEAVYFAAEFEVDGVKVAVAESPKYGDATYIHVEDDKALGSWQEVFLETRQDARILGANKVIHSKVAPHGEEHIARVIQRLRERIIAGKPVNP